MSRLNKKRSYFFAKVSICQSDQIWKKLCHFEKNSPTYKSITGLCNAVLANFEQF
jgi:hypothetical protein